MKEKMAILEKQMKEKDLLVEINPSMSRYTSFKAGGNAALLLVANTMEELRFALRRIDEMEVPSLILGNGSNTLFQDRGYQGAVIKLGRDFETIHREGNRIIAGSAALLSAVAREALKGSLTGMEFASGIPGSLGGAIFMNAGAYGGEMKDILRQVRAISRDGKEEKIFSTEELQLSYRHSALEENGYLVLYGELQLKKGDAGEIGARMKELAEKRNAKQPVNYPSAGSTFKRPEGYFAGKLIEDAGLKGVSIGGAQVSVLHSGFIINRGDATATDILDLIRLVQNRVYDQFGVALEPEVRIIE